VVARSNAAVLKQAVRSVEALVALSGASDRELLRRFAAENDQAAFAALVRRYTGMVLNVCGRAGPNVQDAEDACQATFLVLARKAKTGRWQQSVANWLYTTAWRVACKARQAAQRRARREGKAAVPDAVHPADQVTGRELLAALHEELDRLPARYRDPLVLCYLEGLTREEVAARLGVPAGTVKIQLERGRKRLGDALSRRGCGLGAGLLALAATSRARAAPPRLIEAVLAAASGPPPAAVAALARGVTMNALVHRGTPLALAVVTAGLLGFALASVRPPAAQSAGRLPGQAERATEKPKDPPPAKGPEETQVSGRVLGPEGKPAAGAELVLVGRKQPAERLGRADEQGRFSVAAPRGNPSLLLLARAPGAGIDLVRLGSLKGKEKVELRLVKDHPVRGRVIDTEGKPVPGVAVSVHRFNVCGATADRFLDEWKRLDSMSAVPRGSKYLWDEGAFPAATTGKDGRFTITGLGAERAVSLRLRGAGLADSEVWVLNRAGFDPGPYNRATADNVAREPFPGRRQWLLNGPEPSVVLEAEKPIRGVVKDRDTGSPRAGVRVSLTRAGDDGKRMLRLPPSATTDARGRYEIRGARKSKGYTVEVAEDPAGGYMASQARADDTPGHGPITLDVPVKKGVVIAGRVLDRSTGKPVPGFVVTPVAPDNPFAKDYPQFESAMSFRQTADDGSFRVVTIPRPVILMGGPDRNRLPGGDLAWLRYKPPVPDPKYPKYFGTGDAVFTLGGGMPIQGNFCKVLEIKPGAAVVRQDVVLEPANALPVQVTDGAGRPVAGTWAAGVGARDWNPAVRFPTASCTAYHLEPGKPRLLVFHDPAGKLFGLLRLRGDEKGPTVVKLGPGASVKGRLVGDDGAPVAGAAVQLYHHERPAQHIHELARGPRLAETGADGRFQIDQVVPGVKFSLSFSRGPRSFGQAGKAEWSAAAGKALDVGDVKVKP
jgi:RNA polymerase sigma factor (sigma-70 family)